MHKMLFPILLALLLTAPAARAQAPADPAMPGQALVHVDVSVELDAIERSVQEISRSFDDIAASMQQIAADGELSVAQQENLDSIMGNLDHVVGVTRDSVDALPEAVARTRGTVRDSAREWLADLKVWFFVAVVVVALLLVIALAAFYRFTIRPLQHTVLDAVGQIAAMAKAMADTSKSLEVINETNREVLRLAERQGGAPAGPAGSEPG